MISNIISVQHRTLEFWNRFEESAAPIFERLFTLCFRQHREGALRDTQDMVQRWHDETDHGRNRAHYENALAVNIAICVPSLHLLAFQGL